ncbi:hypothetical protein V6N11_069735 [Hibiscus sabdariffa]|uniref:Uncharacterized protein n=1 Tax=Hibiscus sabdariffa TaxID=183260 RepID=A0ABR2Q489_9ROSI
MWRWILPFRVYFKCAYASKALTGTSHTSWQMVTRLPLVWGSGGMITEANQVDELSAQTDKYMIDGSAESSGEDTRMRWDGIPGLDETTSTGVGSPLLK